MKRFVIFVFSLLIISCWNNKDKENNKNNREFFIGTWQSEKLDPGYDLSIKLKAGGIAELTINLYEKERIINTCKIPLGWEWQTYIGGDKIGNEEKVELNLKKYDKINCTNGDKGNEIAWQKALEKFSFITQNNSELIIYNRSSEGEIGIGDVLFNQVRN